MTPEKKKKISRVVLIFGALVLAAGFFPGWLAYQWGIVIFVFCLVAAGIIKIIIPEPDPAEPEPTGESHVEKVLQRSEEEPEKEKTDSAV